MRILNLEMEELEVLTPKSLAPQTSPNDVIAQVLWLERRDREDDWDIYSYFKNVWYKFV